ncbi:MAG TPA: spore germination protein, partial [Bacillota bacterium]|nr:spore germination protein [Bacillota bacterium]
MSGTNSITPIAQTVSANLEQLSRLLNHSADLNTEFHGIGDCAGIAYLRSLVDLNDLKSHLLEPLIPLLAGTNRSLQKITVSLPAIAPHVCPDLETAVSDLLEGRTVLFLADETSAVSFATQGWVKHEPKEPLSERVLRGPREGFTETLDDNIGMIRRWVKDPHLHVDTLTIGRRSKTKVAVMYLGDVAQPRLVKEVHRRLSAIDIDGVIESGYIEQLIKDRRASIFPLTQSTERTDKVAAALLEGRVAILVDKSPFTIIVPTTVNELYQSPEDYYFDFWLGSFLRLLRLLGNNLAVALPGLYVALVSVNPELLPTQFALAITAARAHIPFPLIVEVLILEFTVEIFREAGLRLPGTIGETMGVVGGIVLGIAGVQSGLVSPATLVVVIITAIASFSGPNYSVTIAWRLLKYLLLFGAAIFGFFGLTVVGVGVLLHAADLKSFGVSYLAPWSPPQWRELADGPVR